MGLQLSDRCWSGVLGGLSSIPSTRRKEVLRDALGGGTRTGAWSVRRCPDKDEDLGQMSKDLLKTRGSAHLQS